MKNKIILVLGTFLLSLGLGIIVSPIVSPQQTIVKEKVIIHKNVQLVKTACYGRKLSSSSNAWGVVWENC